MKARQAHELPLSPAARAIIEARQVTSDLVFSSAGGRPFNNWANLLKRARAKAGGDASQFWLHDIRRAFVSHLAGRFDIDALDQCLAHVRPGISGVYQKSLRWPDRVSALNTWASLVLDKEQTANVVPLRVRS